MAAYNECNNLLISLRKGSLISFADLSCSSRIETGNQDLAFRDNGVVCVPDDSKVMWKDAYNPSYNFTSGICAGYISVNETVQCSVKPFSDNNIRRLCKCIKSGNAC